MTKPSLSQALKQIAKTAKQSQRRAQLAGDIGDLPEMLSLVKLIEGLVKIHEGEKGEKGDTPIKGVDYFTPKEAALFLKMATPVKGKDYRDGIDGTKGERGEDGKDGIDGVANMAEVQREIENEVQNHAQKFNHELIHDPKILGTYELNPAKVKDGDLLQVKDGKLVGVKIQMPDISGLRNYVVQQGVSNIRHFTITESRELEPFARWIVDATGGDITLTVPSAQGREAQWFEIMRIDGTANTVTVVPTGSETFSGMSNYILQQWTNFQIFGYQNNYLIRQAA